MANDLFAKGRQYLSKGLNEADTVQRRKQLLIAVSFFQQAIDNASSPSAEMYAAMSSAYFDLKENERAKSLARQALQIDGHEFEAYYILYLLAHNEFQDKGGFQAKSKTKVSWGWLAIAALLNPEATGSQLGRHFGDKIGKGVTSHTAGKEMYAAYTGMVKSFIFHSNQPEFDFADAEFMARVILEGAESMQFAGYEIKPVYQILVQTLSALRNCGVYEDDIRELQAQAQGSLSLL